MLKSDIHTTLQAQFLLQLFPIEQHFSFSDLSMEEEIKKPQNITKTP